MMPAEKVSGWGGSEDSFRLSDFEGSGERFLATLADPETPSLRVRLALAAGESRCWLRLEAELPGELRNLGDDLREMLSHAIASVERQRAGPLRCHLREGEVELNFFVYLDGLTRQSLNEAFLEVVKAESGLRFAFQHLARSANFARETERLLADRKGLVKEAPESVAVSSTPVQESDSKNPQRARRGKQKADKTRPCSKCRHEIRSGEMYCPACGSKAPVGF